MDTLPDSRYLITHAFREVYMEAKEVILRSLEQSQGYLNEALVGQIHYLRGVQRGLGK